MNRRCFYVAWMIISLTSTGLMGQSSSLFLADQRQQADSVDSQRGRNQTVRMSAAVAAGSMVAASMPEPRQFMVNDLITIVIRESMQTDFEAKLDTDKNAEYSGELSDLPQIIMKDLFHWHFIPNDFPLGNPKLGLEYESEFEGEGGYSRKESMTGRLTAKIIDVKPNGTLVLEARKYIKSDSETFKVILTGTCRADDVAADNTILTTQLYDLHLVKEHTGELKKSSKKGLITQFLDLLFNF